MNTASSRTARFGLVHALGLFVLLAGTCTESDAATCIWTGAQDSYWSHSGNWTNGIVPGRMDSIIFSQDAIYRDTFNNFPTDSIFKDITIEGRNFVLAGNRINLEGDIISAPSLSTNRILLDLSTWTNSTIANQGYFNLLDLGGKIWMHKNSLVLDTISDILVSGGIDNPSSDFSNVILFHSEASGRLTVADGAWINGNLTVDRGKVILSNGSFGGTINGSSASRLIIGNDTDPEGAAEVRMEKGNRISLFLPIFINHSGVLNMDSQFYPGGITETTRQLGGSGVVKLGNSTLTVDPNGLNSSFSGDIQGTGILQIGQATSNSDAKPAGYFELAGDSTLTGPVTVGLAELRLTGSLSNSVVSLQTSSVMRGNGSTKGLVSVGGHIWPGPGTLRVLNDCSLDFWTQLWIHLDGPDQGRLRAGSLNLNSAYLGLIYQGGGTETSFPLASADTGFNSILRQDTRSLPEGAWLVAGDPASPSEFQITYMANNGHDAVLTRAGPYVQPTLGIQRLSTNEQIIEWPLGAQGYQLERTSPDYLGGWTTNGLPATDTNATDHFVVETNAVPWRFFRLTR